MKKSRTTAFLLLTAILLSACGQGAGDGKETTSMDEISSGGVTETSEPDIYADLPTGDYGGEKFTIFNSTVTWAECRIDS